MADECMLKYDDGNYLEYPESFDAVDVNALKLLKTINDVTIFFEELLTWSKITKTCALVNRVSNRKKFANLKMKEILVKAEKLQIGLQDSIPCLLYIIENCDHLNYLWKITMMVNKFLLFVKDLNENDLLFDVYKMFSKELEMLSELSGNEFIGCHHLEPTDSQTSTKESQIEFEELSLMRIWAEETMRNVTAQQCFGGLPETAQEHLKKHMILLEDIKLKHNRFKQLVSSYGLEDTELAETLDNLLNISTTRKNRLTEILQDAITFHENLQSFISWLGEAEMRQETMNKMPLAISSSKIDDQLSQYNVFEEAVKSKRLDLLELDKMGSHLKYFSQKQDGTLIKNLLLTVHARWDNLLSAVSNQSLVINDVYKKSKQFHIAFNDFMGWMESAANALDVNVPCYTEYNMAAEAEVQAYEDLQKAILGKKPVCNAVVHSGVILLQMATLSQDENEINEHLHQLEKNWENLKRMSKQRKQRLEDSLNFTEQFRDAVNMIEKWLRINEPSAAYDDRLFGDIHTVNSLMSNHMLAKTELASQHENVVALQQSLRNEDGDSWENEHLQELISRWNSVTEMFDKKQETLNNAEAQAEELQSSVEVFLSELSEVEAYLLLNSKLPRDDFLLQEINATHQVKLMELEKMQKEYERIIKLTNCILDVAHPDAITPIRQLTQVLQTKWFEIQIKGSEHSSRLEDAIQELENNAALIDKLRSWLYSAENSLKAQCEQPILSSNIDILTSNLQSFQDEMISNQSDYERLISMYVTRKSQQITKKSDSSPLKLNKDDYTNNDMKTQCENLQSHWNMVWLMAIQRQKELQEANRKKIADGVSFDVWRKRYRKWLRHKKTRIMDFFRNIDKDADGKISRKEFIDGIIKSKFPTSESEITNVCNIFDQDNDGFIDYYKFVVALYPKKETNANETEADQIENEVVRQVATCTCCKRFHVQQISENKYRFGDNQQLRLVRILKSTVMVRVGGGWMALDEFLVKNDPCRAKKRTNTELRERFSLAAGTSQSMSPFRSKKPARPQTPKK